MAKLKTNVGQIFITHGRDENFASLYEEAFSKHGQTFQIFAVLEVENARLDFPKENKQEYEKLVQNIVGAFKRTYISAPIINDELFEKSLAAINAALSRVASKSKVSWYGKLNAAIGIISGNELSLSTTGSGLVYLARGGEFTLLSEGLAEIPARGTKIFTNFSSGTLRSMDRIIFSTNQLFNYLSFERIKDFLVEEELNEACQEIIKSLTDVRSIGFSTFIVEVFSPGKIQSIPAEAGIVNAASGARMQRSGNSGTVARQIIFPALQFVGHLLLALAGLLRDVFLKLFRRRSKKYLFLAIALIALLFTANLVISSMRKSSQEREQQVTSVLSQVRGKLDEAEAAQIYGDDKRVASLIIDAEKLLSSLNSRNSSDERKAAEDRLNTIKGKINKETGVESPTVLTQFPNIPTDLIHSPNGFVGFNRDSGSLAFYDFRLGETKAILQDQNTSDLVLGAYVGAPLGYVFLDSSGVFRALDVENQRLTESTSTTTKASLNLTESDIAGVATLGEGVGARMYAADTKQNQVWRMRVSETDISLAEKWLKGTASLDGTRSIAVDGSIYVQFPDHVEKYFNGQKQAFELSAVIPAIENLVRIFTKADYQFIYILEPAKNRVLVYNKDGKLDKQITSPKFHDLSDIHVDEKSKIIYILAGNELLQVNY